MITFLILFVCSVVVRFPSDMLQNLSNDTVVILACLCVISDLHILSRSLHSR